MGGLAGLGAVLVPVRCPGCGVPDVVVCARCRTRVLHGPLRRRLLGDGTTAVASCAWRGPARGLVGGYKERGREDVLPVLALALARAVAEVVWSGDEAPRGPVLLVPPPWGWRSRLARGGARPAERLARAAAAVLVQAGARAGALGALRLVRAVQDQAGLDRAAREANLVDAHRVGRPYLGRVAGATVVVVDDVVTSGATALEAGRALRDGGADVLGTASVAQA